MYTISCTVLLVKGQSIKVTLQNKNSLMSEALILVYSTAEV